MERRAKPAAGKAGTAPAAAGRPPPAENSTVLRLERRLAEALEQQAATNEILRVIRGSRTDVQPVFDAIATSALRLCDAPFSSVFRFDGEQIHVAALANLTPEGTAAFLATYPTPPGRGGATQRAIFTRRVVHIPDIRADPEYVFHEAAQRASFRSALSVPMLRDGEAIGTITVYRDVARPFPDTQIELLKTFAQQAVIAIENVRVFTELEARNRDLTVALDQQTATSEILRVISSSQTDVQPVFDTIVRNAVRLCGADYSIAARFDGELLHPLAHHGFSPEALAMSVREFPMRPSRRNMLGRAALARAVDNLPDMLADPDYSREFALAGGWRSGLAVPMLRDGALIGAIAVARTGVGAFPDHLVTLLQTFADQAVIAVENVRLFRELQDRNSALSEALEQQTATSEILRVISSSPTDVQPVFDTIAQRAGKLCDAEVAVVSRFDGKLIELAAIHGLVPEGVKIIRTLYPMKLGAQTVTARVIRGAAAVHIPDVLAEEGYEVKDFARAAHYRSGLGVPIVRNRQVIGSIFVGREKPGLFADAQVQLLETFADQAVIAIENVRLFTELEARNRDLTIALDRQTATSEILRAISSSPTDVQPVFDIIGECAERLCDAEISVVAAVDGGWIRQVALHGASPSGHGADRPPLSDARRCPDRDGAHRQQRGRGSRPRRAGRSGLRGEGRGIGRRIPRLPWRADVPRGAGHRVDLRRAHDPRALQRLAGRAAEDLRRPGRDRDRERAAVQRAGGADHAADAVGGRAEGAGRGRTGRQLDAGAGDGAPDHRLPRDPARRHGRRRHLRVRRGARGSSTCTRRTGCRTSSSTRCGPRRFGRAKARWGSWR